MAPQSRLHILAFMLATAPVAGLGQIIDTHEVVDLESPEGWAMAYMTAASLNLGQLPPRGTSFGEISFSAELGSIPKLNEDQQQIGFSGFKYEDMNKSPVFGRARASLGLFWDVTAELSWTPPLEIDRAKPEGLWGFALSKPLLGGEDWGLGLRVYAVEGDVRADVTCSEEIAANPPGSLENLFNCVEPSRDRLEMDHYGAELSLTMFELPLGIQPWASVAITRMDPFVQVDALLLGGLDLSTIDSKGTTETYSAGLAWRVNDNWILNLATSYTPLEVRRAASNPGGQDSFWNLRLGLTWDL